MTLPRSVADVLSAHVTLEVESIDRMYLNVYQPRLQTERGVAAFFRFHRGETFASSALMDPISKSFTAAVGRFVEQELPVRLTREGCTAPLKSDHQSGGSFVRPITAIAA